MAASWSGKDSDDQKGLECYLRYFFKKTAEEPKANMIRLYHVPHDKGWGAQGGAAKG